MSSPSHQLEGKIVCTIDEALDNFERCKFVDGSWFLKGRSGREEYEAGPRIQGAVYFDIDDVASKGQLNPKSLKHMMPPRHLFAASMDALGIANDDQIILYVTQGCPMAHRSWFQIRGMGHDKITLMQGGLDDWKTAGGPIEQGQKKALRVDDLDLSQSPTYQATDAQDIVDMEHLLDIVEQGEPSNSIVVDVRSKDRFLGLVEEPRPGMRLGHMPGALNLPFTDLLDPENPTMFKSPNELQDVIRAAGIDVQTEKQVVVSCGSGATACALVAALEICGRDRKKTAVYDGSWSEWGGDPYTPIVKA